MVFSECGSAEILACLMLLEINTMIDKGFKNSFIQWGQTVLQAFIKIDSFEYGFPFPRLLQFLLELRMDRIDGLFQHLNINISTF